MACQSRYEIQVQASRRRSERVFEAFYTTKSGRFGLGLSICRSIIEAHNGRLRASPNVPRGAVFRFFAACSSGRRIVSGMPLRIRHEQTVRVSKHPTL